MKKCLILLFVLIFLSGCSTDITHNSSASSTPLLITNAPQNTSPFETLLSYNATYSSIYKEYGKKYSDLAYKYGRVGITNNSDYYGYGRISYLTGVCVVDLIDFNGDGVKDMFVIYSNGKYTGKNVDKLPIPQAASYEIEIWTCTDGVMKQLLHQPFVGDFLSFKTDYWDTDNCIVSVYENKAGFPVIQLFSENKSGLSYTNLYYSNDKVVTDKLTYSGKSFSMNGSNITEAAWNVNISAYNKILLSVYLSSDSFSSDNLKSMGADYNDTLNQTKQVLQALNNSQPVEFKVAEGNYISLYLQEMDKTNRSVIDSDVPYHYSYSLYDIDKNGSPELITDNYYTFYVYTMTNGAITDCGNNPFKDCALYYDGKSGLIMYGGHMGYYSVNKVTLNNSALTYTHITEGYTESDYPELSTFGLGDYKKTLTQLYTQTPYLLYMYN